MSEQKLEEVFTFRVAVYRPDDKTTKCFLLKGGNRRFRPLAQGYVNDDDSTYSYFAWCDGVVHSISLWYRKNNIPVLILEV
jgi:hypothetical protein